MKTILNITLIVFLLTACDCRIPFYIKNHEAEDIDITLKYLKEGHYYEFDSFLMADEILSNKSVKKDNSFNRKINVNNLDSHSIKISIPANSTVKVEPMYVAYNVDYLVLNSALYTDTIFINGLHSTESHNQYEKLVENGTIEKLGNMPCYQVFNIKIDKLKGNSPQ